MSRKRILISCFILTAFFGAIISDYWSELLPGVMYLFNSARSVGAETVESQVFAVRNSSNATQAQVVAVVHTLENQFTAISRYVKMAPTEKLPLLIVNGRGPAMMDGTELVINYSDGVMDTDLAPLFLVLMIEEQPLNMDGGLVVMGGYGLHVVEASDQGKQLTRQTLDSWTVLLRKKNAYLPLEEALNARVPNDELSGYIFIRALLESGSFMKWFTSQYGLDATRAYARGGDIAALTGKALEANETQWLDTIAADASIHPRSCGSVVPQSSLFRILCMGLDGRLK
jgi:hypothetical protein